VVFPCCNSCVSVTGRNCGLSGCGWHYFNPWMYTCHNDCSRCYVDTNPSVCCWEQRLIASILRDDRLEMEWLQLVCMAVVRPGFSSSNMSHRHGRPALVLRISPFISLQEAASQSTIQGNAVYNTLSLSSTYINFSPGRCRTVKRCQSRESLRF